MAKEDNFKNSSLGGFIQPNVKVSLIYTVIVYYINIINMAEQETVSRVLNTIPDRAWMSKKIRLNNVWIHEDWVYCVWHELIVLCVMNAVNIAVDQLERRTYDWQ